MTERNNGGPAFPAMHFDLGDDEHGMTLRDYFAVHAGEEDIKRALRFVQHVETVLSSPNGHKEVIKQYPTNAWQIARYIVADQMLEARK